MTASEMNVGSLAKVKQVAGSKGAGGLNAAAGVNDERVAKALMQALEKTPEAFGDEMKLTIASTQALSSPGRPRTGADL